MNKLKLIKRSLNSRIAYLCGKTAINIKASGFIKEAMLYFLAETRAAYRGERPVFWCSTFVPPELIYALGGVPFMPEVAAGFSATMGFADEIIALGESNWLNSDLCSIHRCGMGLTLQDLMPEPDYIIAASHLCDGAKKYLQKISMLYDCPFYLLDTPYDINNADWLAEQIKKLVKEINCHKVDFESVFAYSNRAYIYHLQINEMRKSSPSIISGERIMNLVPMNFMSFGSKAGVDFYRKLAVELKKRQSGNYSIVKGEKYRLFWLHLKPYYPQQIFTTLRDMGAVISFEEYSQLYWQSLDYRTPYLSLARKMINHFGWGPLDNQLKGIYEIINEYDIDGVIGFSHWGCRQSSGRMDLIKKNLLSNQTPFLNLDGDLIDSRNYREGQLRTRLQAFIELLAGRQGAGVC